MLHLEARVQLEEVEARAVQHELGRAGVLVPDGAREGDRGLAHGRSQLLVEGGGGALLQHLLVAALDRAVALPEVDRRPVAVGQDLDLDVARALDIALAEDAAVAEARLRFPARRLERLLELVGRPHDAHSAAAAPRGGLDDQRVADLVRLARLDDGDAGLAGKPLGLELVAGRADRLRAGADEDEPGRVHGLGEVAVLGQEAVAGVDRVGAGLLARRARSPRSRGRRARTTASSACRVWKAPSSSGA